MHMRDRITFAVCHAYVHSLNKYADQIKEKRYANDYYDCYFTVYFFYTAGFFLFLFSVLFRVCVGIQPDQVRSQCQFSIGMQVRIISAHFIVSFRAG